MIASWAPTGVLLVAWVLLRAAQKCRPRQIDGSRCCGDRPGCCEDGPGGADGCGDPPGGRAEGYGRAA
ncbi:hypothetical protein ACFC3O_24765 [Streptomyces sp. NPDC056007]|uniref:hypothetical protein n=1 Tax=Streptomyces sp. NPDC056007 TaxID=3345678 RepID=UPI0035E29BEF